MGENEARAIIRLGIDQATGCAIVRNRTTGETTLRERTLWNTVRGAYRRALKAIIRPPRARYALAQLGPLEFSFTRRTAGAGAFLAQ